MLPWQGHPCDCSCRSGVALFSSRLNHSSPTMLINFCCWINSSKWLFQGNTLPESVTVRKNVHCCKENWDIFVHVKLWNCCVTFVVKLFMMVNSVISHYRKESEVQEQEQTIASHNHGHISMIKYGILGGFFAPHSNL